MDDILEQITKIKQTVGGELPAKININFYLSYGKGGGYLSEIQTLKVNNFVNRVDVITVSGCECSIVTVVNDNETNVVVGSGSAANIGKYINTIKVNMYTIGHHVYVQSGSATVNIDIVF